MPYKQSLQGLLTICRKAGKLAVGLEPAKDALYRGTAAGVLVCSDAAPRTRKEAVFFSGQAQVPCLVVPFTKLEMGQTIGRASGVLAVCDDGFFQKMVQMAREEDAASILEPDTEAI